MEAEIEKALFKKATGFESEETIEEYGVQDGEMVLLKRKVTKKYNAPDVSAAKALSEAGGKLDELSEEELEKEMDRLLRLLREAADAEGGAKKSKAKHRKRGE